MNFLLQTNSSSHIFFFYRFLEKVNGNYSVGITIIIMENAKLIVDKCSTIVIAEME